VTHDGIPYDLIQGQGQRHGGPKFIRKWPILKAITSAKMHAVKRLMIVQDNI